MATRTFFIDLSGASSGSVTVEPGGEIIAAGVVCRAIGVGSIELSPNPTSGTAARFLMFKASEEAQTPLDLPWNVSIYDLSVKIAANSKIYGFNSNSETPCVAWILVRPASNS